MYKYCVNREIVKRLHKIRVNYDGKFFYVQKLFRDHKVDFSYDRYEVFLRHAPEFTFYWPSKLNGIYLGHYLFPISLFDVEVI